MVETATEENLLRALDFSFNKDTGRVYPLSLNTLYSPLLTNPKIGNNKMLIFVNTILCVHDILTSYFHLPLHHGTDNTVYVGAGF